MAETDVPVLRALNTLWDEIRSQLADVPIATFDLQPGRPSSCGSVEWDTAPVIVLNLRDGYHQNLPARDTLFTLLHLAAHAASRGTSTGSEGRYHSAQFADAARQLGLDVSHERIPGIGYRPEGLARGTLARYSSGLAKLDTALKNWEPEVSRRRDRSAIPLVCSCEPPRRMRMSAGVVALGPITCGVCGEPFRS
jgi:hypothetical protein